LKKLRILVSLILLEGCASYQAAQLSALDPNFVKDFYAAEGMSIGCKQYTKEDCQVYLDRDVIEKGYQPIQLTFYNESDQNYLFSASCISLPCASPREVARSVQTSTTGRVFGYSLGALVFPLLVIPAFVDGIRSYQFNQQLNTDYEDKSKNHMLIKPQTFIKTLLFIPKDWFHPEFDLTLIEENTGSSKTIRIHAKK